jgi:hypothetical protein
LAIELSSKNIRYALQIFETRTLKHRENGEHKGSWMKSKASGKNHAKKMA